MYYKPLVSLLLGLFFFAPLEAISKSRVNSRLSELERVFERQQSNLETRIPDNFLDDAVGIIIVTQYKGGFFFGAKGGHGAAFARDKETGKWSAPAFLKSGEGSAGIQIGGQGIDTVYVVRNQNGLDILDKSRMRIGIDASAAAGPRGADLEAKIGPEISILAYSRARGLYVGASIEGGSLWPDEEANEAMYGSGVSNRDILYGNKVAVPEQAKSLIKRFQSSGDKPEKLEPAVSGVGAAKN